MQDILSLILEFSILLPGMLLAYLPMKQHLRIPPARLAAAASLFTVSLCMLFSFLCCYFRLKALWMTGIAALLCGFFYILTLTISPWKSISFFLAICAAFFCLGNLANAIHGILHPGNRDPWLSLEAALSYVLMCWTLVLICWYPAVHAARSLIDNDRLRQENLLLSMQQAQYDSLRTAIIETREARHNMRHHLNTLQTLAERGEWKALTDYLAQAKDSVPDTTLNLCENTAADAVACHYAILFQNNHIPFSIEFDLPQTLPVSKIDFCLVLSNLLENALEASLHTNPARQNVHAQAYLHSNRILILTVKNTYDGTIREKNGIFQSSKRPGSGAGTQSVRRIAEKNGGSCRFTYENGVFCAYVMLRSTK